MAKDDELNIVVDDNDNVIAYKKREDTSLNDRIRIVGVWIENAKGEVLLAQRDKNKKLAPGLWGPATEGTVEKGESYENTALRELLEETGLRGVALTEVSRHIYDSPQGHKRSIAWYKGICDSPIEQLVPQKGEVEEFAWVSKEMLIDELRNNPKKYVSSAQYWQELFL